MPSAAELRALGQHVSEAKPGYGRRLLDMIPTINSYINPFGYIGATDIAAMVPGGGITQATTEDFPEAVQAYRAGDYAGTAKSGLYGALNMGGDALSLAGPAGIAAGAALKGGVRAAKAAKVGGKAADTVQAIGREGQPLFTGSPDINSTIPVTMSGKQPHEFSPGDWGAFGRAHGAERIGPESDEAFERSLVPITDKAGRVFTIPGGIDDPTKPFTYYDMLHLKAQGINPNDLPPEVHRSIHNRMVAGQVPTPEQMDLHTYNGLTFGMVSPNQPLTANELAQQRVMAKSQGDIDWMADRTPWDPAAKVTAQARHAKSPDEVYRTGPGGVSNEITTDLGLQAGNRGGLGTSGSADYTRISDMAKMYRERPDFFQYGGRPGDPEDWANHVARVASQTPGLSMKTGSLATVWQDPEKAATSAIDRHMATGYHNELFPDKATQEAWEQAQVEKYNAARPDKPVSSFAEMQKAPGGRGQYVEDILNYVNDHKEVPLTKKGAPNPDLPPAMAETNWVRPPDKAIVPSQPYVRALAANQRGALENDQGIFNNQWMMWDRIRERLEPHEIMHPELTKLPRMTLDQMKAVTQLHSDAGYMAAKGTVKPVINPSRLGYFALPAAVGAAAAARESEEERLKRLLYGDRNL